MRERLFATARACSIIELSSTSRNSTALRLLAQSSLCARAFCTTAILLAISTLGCLQPVSDRNDPYAVPLPEQGLHGVDPQRLHYLMARLSEMHLDQIPEDELDDPQPDPNLIRAAGMGEAMVADAEGMPAIVGEGMTRAEKRTLSQYAARYRREAAALARADARQDVPRVRRALVAVTKSCIACHMAIGGPHFAFDNAPDVVEDRPPVRDSRPGHRGRGNAPAQRRRDESPPPRRPANRSIEPDIDDQL